VLPAFTQEAFVALGTAPVISVIAHSVLAPLDTDASLTLQASAAISSELPAFDQFSVGSIPINGSITQTLPALTTLFRAGSVRWPEWSVTSGDEWSVSSGDEWPVTSSDEWLVRT
jgi:hypothetical protein